jgi:hypothetical protein
MLLASLRNWGEQAFGSRHSDRWRLRYLQPCPPPITLNSHWQHKKNAAEVIVTHINVRNEISYIAADKRFSGSVPQWLFLEDFQPVTEKKKPRRTA